MQGLLDRILRRFIIRGRLDVVWPDATATRYGTGSAPGCAVRLITRAAIRELVLNPELAMGEQYMSGGLVVTGGTIFDFLDIVGANLAAARHEGAVAWPGLRLHHFAGRLRRRVDQFNPQRRAARNVAHHYDLDGRLYGLLLGADRQYSCAYFRTGDETLDEAQAAKTRHVAAKLCLDRPDLHVLDIGCGWGGMALHLAQAHGCRVTGITLSAEQLEAARARVAAAGLGDRVAFRLLDYRSLEGRYDRIVSVGMFEHVGVAHYPEFFATLQRHLAPDGVALLHTIARSAGPLSTNKWIARYIFPGGYTPALSEVLPVIERSGLVVADIEVLRLHYAITLQRWRENFVARRGEIAALYDERFCRMFEFYLALSEMAFRRLDSVVVQIQLTLGQAPVPLTRDYIAAAELAALRS